MPIGPFLGALFSVLSIVPALALADGSTPTIPNTPAGHALVSWLDAFNSADRGKFESFAKVHAPC